MYGHDNTDSVGNVLTSTVRHYPIVNIIGNGVHVTLPFDLGAPSTMTGTPTLRNGLVTHIKYLLQISFLLSDVSFNLESIISKIS